MSDHFGGDSRKTAAKLQVLEETLDMYTTIIQANWPINPWYIDTHAGTGETEVEEGLTIDGSTIVALDNHEGDFERFYFYELNDDHFHTLHETLADRFGYEFEVGPVDVPGAEFTVARCDDPYIRIMNMDSNDGVQFLADHAGESTHWFTFIDPKGLTVRRETLDTLIERGNVDILLTYQSEGTMRSAAAEHAHRAVTRQEGHDDWPRAGSPDEYVEQFTSKLEENDDLAGAVSEPFEDPLTDGMRFDLVFACGNEKVTNLIHERMTQDELWEKASSRIGQAGLGQF